jgi:hypothetical protein
MARRGAAPAQGRNERRASAADGLRRRVSPGARDRHRRRRVAAVRRRIEQRSAHRRAAAHRGAGVGAAKAPPPVEVDELALTAFTVAPAAGPPIAADQHAEIAIAPVPAMPPPSYARLESIVSLDGVRRATFRMGDRSIALVEGDAIGGRAVGEIANSEVMLVGEGAPKRVRLGAEIPVE